MWRYFLLAVALTVSYVCRGQLSKGEGSFVDIAGGKYACYLPKYFEVQKEPPGVIHKASGAFVIAVKVPSDKRVSAHEGLSRSFFEDPRYEIVTLKEETATRHNKSHGPRTSYWMHYQLQGFDFERYTTLVTHDGEQYLLIGNYPVVFKDQVQEEIRKIMGSFRIHK